MTEKEAIQPEAGQMTTEDIGARALEPAPKTLSKDEEQTWAVIAHLSSMVNLIGIPSPVGPLIVWLIKRNESTFVAEQAKASLNFALSVWIYGAAFLLLGILSFFTDAGFGVLIGLVLLVVFAALVLLSFIFSIVGALKASNGETYDYPFNIELVK